MFPYHIAAVFRALLVGLLIAPAIAVEPSETDGGQVLHRKRIGAGEFVCSSGPTRRAESLRVLDPASAERLVSVYEFRLDWRATPDSEPLRLWSTVFGVGRLQVVEGKLTKVEFADQRAQRRVKVFDVASGGDNVVLALGGASSLSVYSVAVAGRNEVLFWAPAVNDWTEHDVPSDADPSSVTLDFHNELWHVTVVSKSRRTEYRQVPGRWEFNTVPR